MPTVKQGEANHVRVLEPAFVSLVGKPANKTAWKVVRSDTTEGESQVTKPVLRRTRRSDSQQPIMALRFPEGTTDDSVNATLKAFKMEGYNVTTTAEGVIALRSDLQSIAKRDDVQEIPLTDDGIVAVVAKTPAATQNPGSELSIVSLEFRSDLFSADQVQKWLTENGFEAAEATQESAAEGQGNYIVARSEVPEGAESRRIDLGDGVHAVIIRSDVASVPAVLAVGVYEAAYGSWGWGQLDFAAATADVEFCERGRAALSRLDDVLRNILFYSSLPIADRKGLVNKAIADFGSFMIGLMDALPQQVLTAVVRHERPQLEKIEMTTASAQNSGAPTNTAAAAAGATTISRAEFDAMTKSISDLTALVTTLVPKKEPEVDPNAPVTRGDLSTIVAEATAKAVADALKPVTEAQAEMATRMDKLGNTTVVRSDPNPDPTTVKTTTATGGAGDKKDVFRGSPAFAGLRSTVKSA